MSETKHTKGKWKIERLATNIALIMPASAEIDGLIIATVNDDNDEMTAEMEANANLIAAAPDAYQLLKEINDYLNPREDARQINSVNTSSILHRKIQEWIAKANGGAR